MTANRGDTFIEVRNLNKSFATAAGELQVLKGIHLAIPPSCSRIILVFGEVND